MTVTADGRPVRVDFRTTESPFAVVFIHGFLGRADTTWGDFPRFLAAEPELHDWDVYGVGYSSSLRIDIGGMFGDNASLEVLGYYLRTTLSHRPFDGYRKLALIAHSMGGLIAQQALVDDPMRSRVSHLFLFGTPSAGTRRARFARALHAQARDMAEGSSFIANLRSAWSAIFSTEPILKLRVVAAERDVFVAPHSSLGPFTEASRFVVPGTHLSMVKPKDSADLSVQLVIAGLLDREASFEMRRAAIETPTFLLSDVEESTQRWERYPEHMGDALHRQESIVRSAIARNRGYVYKTVGDKVCAAFDRPERAIVAAVEAQHELALADFSSVDGVLVRMSVHRGFAQERGGDFQGPAINRITRILPIGYGGQTLVSGATAELARPLLPDGFVLRNLGMHRLRDLADPEEVYQVDSAGVRREFPALRSLDAKPNNLPKETNAFVGRETELREVRALVAEYRLVSLLGAGGVGKTRLSLHVAVELFDAFPDGIWLVEFGSVTDPSLVWNAIAVALGLTDAAQRAKEKVVAHLKNHAVLLVADNCEHIVDGIAAAVDELLRQCPKAHVLSTSREALRVEGERVYRMPSLPNAEALESLDPADALRFGSIALFVDRARSVAPRFELTEQNVGTVAGICRRLDGIALAIELAAARIGSVPLESLAQNVESRLLALTTRSRTALPRQQTMRSMIDWSYALLSGAERGLFDGLAIFGGFTLEAAVRLSAQSGAARDEFEAFDLLSALVDKSLVLMETPAGSTRYRLLEPIREFGREKLVLHDELDRISALHAGYYRELAEAVDGQYWLDDSPFDDPLVELANFRAALQWALAEGHDVVSGAAIAAALMRYWFFVGDEGRHWATVARERLPSGGAPDVEARLNLGLAQLEGSSPEALREAAESALIYYRRSGESARLAESLYHAAMTIALYFPAERRLADIYATEAVEVAQTLRAPRLLMLALRAKAVAMDPDDLSGRIATLTRGLDLAREHGVHARLLTSYLMQIAEIEFAAGLYDAAFAHGLEALDESERAGHTRAMTFVKANLAHYAVMTGDAAAARKWGSDALATALAAQDAYSATVALNAMAAVTATDGDVAGAAKLLGFCNARFGTLHPSRQDGSCEEIVYRRLLERIRTALGDERLSALMRHGESLALAQAVRTAHQSTG